MLPIKSGRVGGQGEGVKVVDAVLLAVLGQVGIHGQYIGVGLHSQHRLGQLSLLDGVAQGVRPSHDERVVPWRPIQQRLQGNMQPLILSSGLNP